jgi:triacylglycerol esterase/lipase EstA (alpha/beta hydrolase family)
MAWLHQPLEWVKTWGTNNNGTSEVDFLGSQNIFLQPNLIAMRPGHFNE